MARNPLYNDDYARKNQKRYKLSQDYTRPYFDRFIDNYKHYFIRTIDEAIEADQESYPFYSNLMLPITYQIVETILPRMFSRMFNFNIKTEQDNDTQDEAAMRELIKYQMNHPYLIDDPIFARMVSGLKEEFITGNSWGEVPWYLKEAEVEEWQPYSRLLGIEEPSWENLEKIAYYGLEPDWMLVKVKKRVIDAPVYQHRNIFHVFPDPKKKRVSDLEYVIVEDFMTMDEIMEMVEVAPSQYKNVDTLKKMKAQKDYASEDTENYDQQMAEIFGGDDFNTKDNENGQYKVWFVKEEESYGIIINEKLTIRQTGNPNGDGKLGMFLMKDIPVPHQLYAWGEPDPIKKIEDAMSDQANMRSDNVFYDLMRIWKLDPGSLVEGEIFTPEPGAIVQMNDLNGLEPVETGQTKSSAYREYQEWDKILQGVSGVTDYASGQVEPGMNDTKGGVELLQAAANARFALKLQLFESLGVKAMGTMYVQRNMRFFDSPQWVDKQLITPSRIRRIRGNVHFMVDSGSSESVSRATELKKWDTIIAAQGKVPFANPSEKAQDKMRKGMLYALGETDVDELAEQAQPQPPPTTPTLPTVPDGSGGGVAMPPGGGTPPTLPVAPQGTPTVENAQPSTPEIPAGGAEAPTVTI